MDTKFLPIWVAILICIIIPAINRRNFTILRNSRKKGERRMLPKELLHECIGKICSISLFNESFGITGRIEAAEDNWLKVSEKGGCRLVNGDMVRDIKILPEKYQHKSL